MRARTSKKEKKRLVLISLTIITLLIVLVGSVFNDWRQILKNRQTEADLTKKYENLLDEAAK